MAISSILGGVCQLIPHMSTILGEVNVPKLDLELVANIHVLYMPMTNMFPKIIEFGTKELHLAKHS